MGGVSLLFSALLLLACAQFERARSAYTRQATEQLMFFLSLRFENISSLRMLEFGDQLFIGHFPDYFEPFKKYKFTTNVPSSGENLLPAKRFFEHIGVEHTSIDWNEENGAVKLDCRSNLKNSTLGLKNFDVITNLGFSEHIGESDIEANLLRNQYVIFKNFHDLGHVGTLYFHHSPRAKHWPRHGVCDYDREFFAALIEANKYETILAPTYIDKEHYDTALLKNNILTVFVKQYDSEFMSFNDFSQLPTLRSKYAEYSIRTVSFTFSSGESVTLEVDLTQVASVSEEVRAFCVREFSMFPSETIDSCRELSILYMKKQRVDGLEDDF